MTQRTLRQTCTLALLLSTVTSCGVFIAQVHAHEPDVLYPVGFLTSAVLVVLVALGYHADPKHPLAALAALVRRILETSGDSWPRVATVAAACSITLMSAWATLPNGLHTTDVTCNSCSGALISDWRTNRAANCNGLTTVWRPWFSRISNRDFLNQGIELAPKSDGGLRHVINQKKDRIQRAQCCYEPTIPASFTASRIIQQGHTEPRTNLDSAKTGGIRTLRDAFLRANPSLRTSIVSGRERGRRVFHLWAPAGLGKSYLAAHSGIYSSLECHKLEMSKVRQLYTTSAPTLVASGQAIAHLETIKASDLNNLSSILPRWKSQIDPRSKTEDFCGTQCWILDDADELHPDQILPFLEQADRAVASCTVDPPTVFVFGRGEAFSGYMRRHKYGTGVTERPIRLLGPSEHWEAPYSLNVTADSAVNKGLLPGESINLDAPFSSLSREGRRRVEKASKIIGAALQASRDRLEVTRNLDGVNWLVHSAMKNRRALHKFELSYLQKLLTRANDKHRRPQEAGSAYTLALQQIAWTYLNRTNEHGTFLVDTNEEVIVETDSRKLHFNVQKTLDFSGLVEREPVTGYNASFRFEPLFIHRVLAEQHWQNLHRAEFCQ